MAVILASNISALNAQRRLTQNTSALTQSFSRLASGLRINRAADDAAGLAVSSNLKLDTRVYTQGIRNINDGLSLLNIAEGALRELSDIAIRQNELASQAANGVLSLAQRQALDDEANALVEEFNRIVESIDFNQRKLLDGSFGALVVQGGYGADGGIALRLADELARTVGSGSFQAGVSYLGSSASFISSADLNSDGNIDLISGGGTSFSVRLGAGDGTFGARMSFQGQSIGVAAADFNGDGKLDVYSTGGEGINVFLGNGNGTFDASRSYFTTGVITVIPAHLDDRNSDGLADLLVSNSAGWLQPFLSNGNGTFRLGVSYRSNTSSIFVEMEFADINGDNVDDVVARDLSSDNYIIFGNADGSFRAPTSYNPLGWQSISLVDINRDGRVDIVTNTSYGIGMYFGNGDGTFKAQVSVEPWAVSGEFAISDYVIGDADGDGLEDIIASGYTALSTGGAGIMFGNGNGTFRYATTVAVPSALDQTTVFTGDFNEDGALDIITGGGTRVNVLLANGVDVTTAKYLNIQTQQGALDAMATISDTLQRITRELGAIGSTQSRLGVAVNNLGVSRENFEAAASAITDADIASEAAGLVRAQILQQASTAILSQANVLPQLALVLLGRGS